MSYLQNFQTCMESYEQAMKQYQGLLESDSYINTSVRAPFELISAIHVCELLDLFNKTDASIKMEFTSAQDAESTYLKIINFRKKKDEILEMADTLLQAKLLEEKINSLVDSNPYLSKALMMEGDSSLYNIAEECVARVPKYTELLSKKFRNRFTESCIEYLAPEELDKLILDKIIKNEHLDTISPVGSTRYNTHLAHLCAVFERNNILIGEYKQTLKGVTFANDDNVSRQALLGRIKEELTAGKEVSITATQCIFTPELGKPEPSVKIEWKGNIIGFLPRESANQLAEISNSKVALEAKVLQITGGGDVIYGCDINLKAYSMVREQIPAEMSR